MMRNVPMKLCALVLGIWYLVSIIGFGVHTCMGSQRSFITTFVTGMTCEDIHPDHHCCCDAGCHSDCSHDQDDCSYGPSSCCSDDFVVLSVTGTLTSSENDFCACCSGYCLSDAGLLSGIHHLYQNSETYRIILPPDSGLLPSGDIQSVLGIWRI